MANALIYDGGNDYALLNSTEDFGDTGEYVIELSFNIDVDTVNDIHSMLHGSDYFYYRQSNSRFYWAFSGSTAQLTGVAPIDVLGIDHVIELRQDAAGNKTVYSPVFGTKTFNGVRNFNFNKFVRDSNWRFDGKMYYVKVYSDLAKTNLIRHWSSDASDRGVGTPVWKEVVSGNDATGYNMPTDGSAWYSESAAPIDLTFGDISVTTQVDSMQLERVTSLDYSDVNIITQIDSMQLERISALEFSDIEIKTYVDILTLVDIGAIQLEFNDIVVGTYVDPISVTRIANLSYSDATIATQVDSINLNRTTSVQFDDINVSTQVDSMQLGRVVALEFSDAEITTQVDVLTLIEGLVLEFKDVVITTQVDSMQLQKTTSLEYKDVDIPTTIDSLDIQRYTDLEFKDVAIATQVDNLTLITQFMPDFGLDDVALVSATINYSIINDTIQYKVTKL